MIVIVGPRRIWRDYFATCAEGLIQLPIRVQSKNIQGTQPTGPVKRCGDNFAVRLDDYLGPENRNRGGRWFNQAANSESWVQDYSGQQRPILKGFKEEVMSCETDDGSGLPIWT